MTIDPMTGQDMTLAGFSVLVLVAVIVLGVIAAVPYLRLLWKRMVEHRD